MEYTMQTPHLVPWIYLYYWYKKICCGHELQFLFIKIILSAIGRVGFKCLLLTMPYFKECIICSSSGNENFWYKRVPVDVKIHKSKKWICGSNKYTLRFYHAIFSFISINDVFVPLYYRIITLYHTGVTKSAMKTTPPHPPSQKFF